MELARNGRLADLMETGAIVMTAFCGPCFGAGDTPANNRLDEKSGKAGADRRQWAAAGV